MRNVNVISATQIELFRQCPRLWVERYLFGNRTPTTPEMEEGLEVHKAIEQLLKAGTMVTGRWETLIKKVRDTLVELKLFDPQWEKMLDGVESEKPVRVRTTGPWFTGAIDILDTRGEQPIIYDVKSKNSLGYILNEFQISADVQMSVYAYWVLTTLKASSVKLVHIYVLRDETHPIVKMVETIVTLKDVEQTWNDILGITEKMTEYGKTVQQSSLEIPGNENSCFKFGRPCHYLDQCEPQPALVGLRTKPKKEEPEVSNDSDWIEELRRKKANKTPNQVQEPTPLITVSTSVLPPDAPSRVTPVEKSAVTATAEPPKEEKKKTRSTTKPKDPLPSTSSGRKIYVGCAPLGRAVGLYSDWCRPIEKQIAERHRVSHWHAIEYHAVDIMASALEASLPTLPQEIVMHGDEPSAGIFLSLVSEAEIIRGW